MPLRIGVDVDGVLADFRSAFRRAAQRCLGREIAEPPQPADARLAGQRDVKLVWEWVGKRTNWWVELQPYEPEQIARLYSAARAGGWEVFFLTNRPASAGDTVQFQTQWWIERHGFFLPAVLTVPGSRGEIANGLRLDVVVDDLAINCVDVITTSAAKALLMQRNPDQAAEEHALSRGIGVVHTLAEAIAIFERLHELLPARQGRLVRLMDWFLPKTAGDRLPHDPRPARPLPPGPSTE